MDDICRTCLRSPKMLLPLFDGSELPQKIETISSIKVSETDKLPSKICAECVININLAYNFRRVIINANLVLQERLTTVDIKDEESNQTNAQEFLHVKTEDDKEQAEHSEETDISFEIEEMIEITENKCLNNISENTDEFNPKIGLCLARLKKVEYKCNLCDFKTTECKIYRSHKLNKHIVKKKSVCNICGKGISPQNLKKHISIHTELPVKCKECGRTYKNSECLRLHKVIHDGLQITCEFCGQNYKYRTGYKRHVKKHHSQENLKNVQCQLCDKQFFDSTTLKKHLQTHTGERPYPCEFCKKGFSSSYALKTHVRQHTNERPYTCTICPMAFPQKVSLRTHMKSKHAVLPLNVP